MAQEVAHPRLLLEDHMGRRLDFNQVKHNMCASDVESLCLKDMLTMADDECRLLWDEMAFGYTDSEGEPLLREEVANLHGVDKEDVVIVCPQEGIYIAMTTLTRMFKSKHETDTFHAISTFPAYQALYENLKLQGVNMSYWEVRRDSQQGWHFCLDDLRALLKDDTRILVINFPHNPTGAVLSPEQRTELVQLCRERGIFVFSDEIYSFSENDGSSPPPSLCSQYEDSISMCGMSKTLALPGLRMGWVCTRNKEVLKGLCYYKDFTTMCSARPSEIMALIAIRSLPYILGRTMDIVGDNVRAWTEFFSRHQDVFEWVPPTAGLVSLVRMRGPLAEVGATEMCRRALEWGGVLLLPGPLFGYDDQHFRVGFARRGLQEGLEVFEKFLDEQKIGVVA